MGSEQGGPLYICRGYDPTFGGSNSTYIWQPTLCRSVFGAPTTPSRKALGSRGPSISSKGIWIIWEDYKVWPLLAINRSYKVITPINGRING